MAANGTYAWDTGLSRYREAMTQAASMNTIEPRHLECRTLIRRQNATRDGQDEDNKKVVAAALAEYGGIHAALINAGRGSVNGFMEATDEEIDQIMGVNFKGVVFGVKHLVSWTF